MKTRRTGELQTLARSCFSQTHNRLAPHPVCCSDTRLPGPSYSSVHPNLSSNTYELHLRATLSSELANTPSPMHSSPLSLSMRSPQSQHLQQWVHSFLLSMILFSASCRVCYWTQAGSNVPSCDRSKLEAPRSSLRNILRSSGNGYSVWRHEEGSQSVCIAAYRGENNSKREKTASASQRCEK